MRNFYLTLSFLGLFSGLSNAAGVSVGATRLIYPSDKNQVTVKIYNTDKTGNYLIQSWVSNEKGDKLNDYVVTPPLFVLKGDQDSVLRIVYTGDKSKLPTNKETIAYFNAKVIPSLTDEQQKIPNALLIATVTKIKVFMRPASLMEGSYDAYKKITCSYDGNKIKVNNTTPYYMNLNTLRVNGQEVAQIETIPPMDAVYINTPLRANSMVFNVINDSGAQIKDQVCSM